MENLNGLDHLRKYKLEQYERGLFDPAFISLIARLKESGQQDLASLLQEKMSDYTRDLSAKPPHKKGTVWKYMGDQARKVAAVFM